GAPDHRAECRLQGAIEVGQGVRVAVLVAERQGVGGLARDGRPVHDSSAGGRWPAARTHVQRTYVLIVASPRRVSIWSGLTILCRLPTITGVTPSCHRRAFPALASAPSAEGE